jgi:hypothetical protein
MIQRQWRKNLELVPETYQQILPVEGPAGPWGVGVSEVTTSFSNSTLRIDREIFTDRRETPRLRRRLGSKASWRQQRERGNRVPQHLFLPAAGGPDRRSR